MSLVDDIARFLLPLKIKMQTMIGRAVLLAVDNSGKTQRVRIKFNGDELIEEIERLQEYGLETNPPIDNSSEVVINCIGGQRELAFVTKMQARALRPQGLTAGEVQLWSKFSQRIYLKADGSIEIADKDDKTKIIMDAAGNATVTSTTKIKLDVPAVELSDGTLRQLIDERVVVVYNAHTHTGNLGAPTSPPIVPMVLANVATAKTKAG